MKKIKLTFVLFLFATMIFGQDAVSFDCYKDQIHSISSIDPNNTDFSDLQFLKDVLQDRQIVILGEASHGDGGAFSAKARMIKFLIEELDFNTIALEAGGFWEMYYANEKLKEGSDISTELDNAWLGIWTLSEQTRPLIDYLHRTENHINLWGIDNQGENNYFNSFPQILKELIGEQALESTDYKSFEDNFAQIKRYLAVQFGDTTQTHHFDRVVMVEDLETIQKNLLKSNSPNAETMGRGVYNILDYLEQIELMLGTYQEQNKGIDRRDEIMAENLNWWLKKNPDNKVIVWTANLHASSNLDQVIYKENDDFYQVFKPFGHRLKMEHGDKLFSIAITAAEGETAYFYDPNSYTIQAEPGSWEFDLAKNIETPYAFINFEKIRSNKNCSDTVFKSKILGYRNRPGKWFNVYDGVLYIREMERSVPRE